MFFGRKNEIDALDKFYNSSKFEFVVIYGRRRVGKTALISHFIKGKDSIYFMGVEGNEKQNLENFSKSILEYSTGFSINTVFSSFQEALEYLFKLAESKRIVLAIDEYPYLASSSKSLSSTLQLLIDKYKDTSKLMLILCGSSMSFMENNVLSYKSPLYGRKTAQLKISPFTFEETCEYLQGFSIYDKALIYGIVGGTPQYLLQIDNRLSVEENIKNTFLNPNSPLFEEPSNLLKQEMREPAIYNSIITAIANGASRMSEISSKIGEGTSLCSTYIKNLLSLGIVQRETPFGDDSSKKAIYSIEDNMFRFWYRFIPENYSIINRGATDLAYKRIEPHLSSYMGKVFEEICKQYLWKLLVCGKLEIEFSSIGRWWGNDIKSKAQIEIDIMGEQDKASAIFGECKWTNERVDHSVLETLVYRSELFHYKNSHLYLFSKSGFTKGCIDLANKLGNITLVCFEQMV